MFLIERLFGVTVYVFFLVLFCFLLWKNDESAIGKILFVYSIVLSIMAYFYVPYKTADLYRIYDVLDSLGGKTFRQVISSPNVSAGNVYYWLIARTGNRQFLPAINSLICYNCIFYIISKTAKKYRISGGNVALSLFFYMSTGTYIFVISGIRSMLGISLMSFCFFRESVECKFNILHVAMYVVAFFIHHYVAALIVFRFISVIFNKGVSLNKKCVCIGLLLICTMIITTYFSNYVDQIFDKSEGYIKGNAYSYFWDYIIGLLIGIVNGYLLFRYKRYFAVKNGFNLYGLYSFAITLYLISIGFCFEFSIFHRTIAYIVPIICLPIWLIILQDNNSKAENGTYNSKTLCVNEANSINVNFCIFIYILILFLSCSRGTLCSLKFFVL